MRVDRGWCLTGLVAVAIAGLLAGCGLLSPARPSPPRPHSARGLLAATVAALDAVSSFHLEGHGRDAQGQPMGVTGEFNLPGKATVSVTEGPQVISFVILGQIAYLEGNAPYWIAHGAAAGAVPVLSQRWLKLPARRVPTLAGFRALSEPATLGRCLVAAADGRVTLARGSATVAGTPAIVLRDHGNRPGSAPGRIYLPATGPLLPLRLIQTGPSKPGGRPSRSCGTSGAGSSAGRMDLRVSGYNQPSPISAPFRAIDLAHLRSAVRDRSPRPVRTTGPGLAIERAQASAMAGFWLATGRVIQAPPGAGFAPGTILARVWKIAPACAAHRCGLYLSRTTGQGAVAARLVWAGGHWTASFVETVSCTPSGSVTQYSNWTITVGAQRIQAVEHNRATEGCGPPVRGVLHWSAHHARRSPGSGSSS